jgi:hypothetical protein
MKQIERYDHDHLHSSNDEERTPILKTFIVSQLRSTEFSSFWKTLVTQSRLSRRILSNRTGLVICHFVLQQLEILVLLCEPPESRRSADACAEFFTMSARRGLRSICWVEWLPELSGTRMVVTDLKKGWLENISFKLMKCHRGSHSHKTEHFWAYWILNERVCFFNYRSAPIKISGLK